MIVQVQFKDPDASYEAIDDAVAKDVSSLKLAPDEVEAVFEKRKEKAQDALRKWIRHGEYVTIEFDTEKGTATVVQTP